MVDPEHLPRLDPSQKPFGTTAIVLILLYQRVVDFPVESSKSDIHTGTQNIPKTGDALIVPLIKPYISIAQVPIMLKEM